MAAEWHGQVAANSRRGVGLLMHPTAHRVTRPWDNYLGFAQHCQMLSLGHSSSKLANFCGVGEHIQLVITNYEGGIYLKTFKIV